jgi:uncharacterized protein (TIGR02996 family)
VTARKRDGKALLDAIYAAPHDLEARMIYGDYLQDRGDPRGELITLQLQPERTAAQRAREAVLVEEHGEKWIGKLAEITTWIEFELGFLARCGIASVPGWALDRREWATVKHIGLSDDWSRNFAWLVVRPQLLSLESLRVPARVLPALCSQLGPARVRTLIVDGQVSPELRAKIAAAPVFAKLAEPIDVR